MLRFLFGVALLASLALAVAFVPVHGRTVLARWHASRSPREFVERAWAEARGAWSERQTPRPARALGARPARAGARRPATPTERHTEQDRAALERIVAEHAATTSGR